MDIDREITTSFDGGDSRSSEDQPLPSTDSRLTFYDAFTLLVSLQLGSGVFSSPSQVNNHSPSPGASLIIWAICGAVAWAGAASFAELGAAMPVNGGLQEYLHQMYGSYMAFLASWIWIFAVKPSSMAILSIICAKYWTEIFLPANDQEPFWLNKIIAMSALAMMIFFNSISTRATSRLANVFLILKLFTVALLLVCCLVFIVFGLHVGTDAPNRDWVTKNWFKYGDEGEDFSFIDWNSASQWSKIGEITMAIYAGLWAYAGWDNANMVAGEMQDAAKELPAAIHTAVPAVIVCFLCANLSYYILIPWNVIGASDTVAETAGQNVLGRSGAVIIALLVSVACLGSININVFTTARLTISAVSKGYLPELLSRDSHSQNGQPQDRQLQDASRDRSLSSKLLSLFGEGPFWQTPIKAMLFNGCVTIVYILIGTFSALVTFIGIAEYVFFFFTVFGLLHMRVKQPHLHRPYKASIGIPLSFTLISLLLVVRGILAAPVQGITIALLLLSGTIWHFRGSDTFDVLRRRVRYQRVPA